MLLIHDPVYQYLFLPHAPSIIHAIVQPDLQITGFVDKMPEGGGTGPAPRCIGLRSSQAALILVKPGLAAEPKAGAD